MKQQKRNTRTYKTTDSVYKKAMRRAKKEKNKLASLVEEWMVTYAYGYQVDVNLETEYLAKREKLTK
jgi:hypothetical protein